jgi:hypothetical protein
MMWMFIVHPMIVGMRTGVTAYTAKVSTQKQFRLSNDLVEQRGATQIIMPDIELAV